MEKNEFRDVHTRADAKRCVKTRMFQTFSIINVIEDVSQGCLSNKTHFVAFFSKRTYRNAKSRLYWSQDFGYFKDNSFDKVACMLMKFSSIYDRERELFKL